jgi:putative RecB family exonuclease
MPVYSHSKLSTFEQCPLKYKFRYIDYLEPDIKQTIEGFLGGKVHETLEWIYNESLNGKDLTLDEIIDYYIHSWNKDYNPSIKIVKKELDAEYYFNQGIKFLIDYFSSNYPFLDNTIETEKKIILDLDPEGRYKIQGYIDRIVHHKESDIFEIHDYKTSGSIKSQEELDLDRQLALYSLGIKKYFPFAKEVHLVWHFLAFNKKITSKRTDEELLKLKDEIIELISKIESTKEYNPNPSILCNWCEFRSYCPVVEKELLDKQLSLKSAFEANMEDNSN